MVEIFGIMKKHYHFIGIGGIGMSALATLVLTKGHEVSGSDVKENYVIKKLKEKGAEVFIGHDRKCIEGVDVVVYSSAIKLDNPEIVEANLRKIPIIKRAELLSQLMSSQTGIAIAGAHGKTTTTSMVSHLFTKAGLDPTTAIGGIVNETAQHATLGEGKYFIAELDESDGSFLFFNPQYSIITNMDWEHVDYYPTRDDICDAYRTFVKQTSRDGWVVFNGDDKGLREVVVENHPNHVSYGFADDNDIVAKDMKYNSFSCSFECVIAGESKGDFQLGIPGGHNILNALACVTIGVKLKIPFEVIKNGLKDFKGVQRRFQLKGDINDVLIIDDYGHHPTEIKATIDTAKSFGRKRIITIFQPHRYTRTKYLMEDFVKCFSSTDSLVITDIYAASEPPIDGVSAQNLAEQIKKSHNENACYLPKYEIISYLEKNARAGDLILFLGAGDITKIADEFVEQLKSIKKVVKG